MKLDTTYDSERLSFVLSITCFVAHSLIWFYLPMIAHIDIESSNLKNYSYFL